MGVSPPPPPNSGSHTLAIKLPVVELSRYYLFIDPTRGAQGRVHYKHHKIHKYNNDSLKSHKNSENLKPKNNQQIKTLFGSI